jgi:TonB-dependent starch-binding outer membrane protein SusC
MENLYQMKTAIRKICLLFSLFLLSFAAISQTVVKGKVVDRSGGPLIGVTVMKKGTTQGAATDVSGGFEVRLNKGDVLVCKIIGYKTKDVEYTGQSSLTIELEEDNHTINEVVVVGYGTQIKQEVTGSITSVDMDKISKDQATESFENLLQGRVAGLNVQVNSGEPGASPTVIIRGLASVSRTDGTVSDPLYVVDGVPIISHISDDFAATSTNILADLNPQDIEDVVVLKDASAAAIYGSRAANGVILITTKKGKRGRPQINANASYGVNFVPQLRDVAGGVKERQQVAKLYELYAPYGISMPSMYTDITNPFYNNSSDWQGYLYNASTTQNYNTSVRGAGDFGQYSVSLGYLDNEGILFNTGFKRYSLMANTSFNALNNSLTLNNTLALSRTDQSKNPDELSANYSSLLPLPNNPKVAGAEVYGAGRNSSLNDKVRFSTNASVNFLKNFNYNVQLSFEYGRAMNDSVSTSRRTLKSDKTSKVAETKNLLFENTLTYSPKFGQDHNFQLLLGQSAEKTTTSYTKVATASSAVSLSETIEDDDNSIGQSNYTCSTMLSYFSRLNYAYKEKYLAGASLRADGSSKFGASNRWGVFPSVSAGWNFSKEEFLSKYKWLNTGKLRLSYGISGSTWDKNYLALGVMDAGSLDTYNSLLEISYGGISGYSPAWYDGYLNKNLTWVKSEMTDIGLDLSLFDNKVEFIFDAYQKLTKGLLLTTDLPTTSGYNEVYRNAADVLNQGLEFTFNLNQRFGRKLNWTMNLNFAYNKNRVVGLPDGNADIIKTSSSGTDFGSIIRVGNPLNGFFFYQSQGIYQTENEIPVNPKTGAQLVGLNDKVLAVGDRNFKDQNDDYQIDVDDRLYSGDPNPQWTGGWTNDFSYGNWGVSLVSTFTLGRKVVNSDLLDRLSLADDFAGNVSLPNFDKYSIWEKSGDKAKYPTLNPWNDVNQIFTQDSQYIEDGSYFKVKSITLSYNFDKKAMKHLPFLSKARFYCTLDNAATFQRYSGPDAELVSTDGFDSSGGYPKKRMLLFGISLGL